MALRDKGSPPLSEMVAEWSVLTQRRKEIEAEKTQAQQDLRAYAAQALEARQNEINDILEDFGIRAKICRSRASFQGRDPNTEFFLDIGGQELKVTESASDRPSFQTALSTGDKSALGLAFFLAQVRAAPDLSDSTIIFDDPFSSQDMHRQWETASRIRELSGLACQVIVFSHDPRFLQLIEKNCKPCLTLQLRCDDDGNGQINLWSSADELKELYVRQHERISEYAKRGVILDDTSADQIIKDLRPFMEDFIKHRFPGRFKELDMLDRLADLIEENGPSDPFHIHISTLRSINQYIRDYMHGGALPPDPEQLRSQCRKVVRIVGSY